MHVLLLLLLILSGSANVQAADDNEVSHWLEKMASAKYLSYRGTFQYLRGSTVQNMQVIHSFDSNGERERLFSLTDNSKELVRDDKQSYWRISKSSALLVESTGSSAGDRHFEVSATQNNPHYDFELEGVEEIAGYQCRILTIYPKDQYRYGYRLCIESETGLLLKSLTRDKNGQAKEKMEFTSVSFPKFIPKSDLEVSNQHDHYTLLQEKDQSRGLVEAVSSSNIDWYVRQAPPGFSVSKHASWQIAEQGGAVQHIVLTDGIASISIFMAQPKPGEHYSEGDMSTGALNVKSLPIQGYIATIIGEVPKETIDSIAKSLDSKVAER